MLTAWPTNGKASAALRSFVPTDDSEETALFSPATTENYFSHPAFVVALATVSVSRIVSFLLQCGVCETRSRAPSRLPVLPSFQELLFSHCSSFFFQPPTPPLLFHTLCVSTISPPCGQFMNGTQGTVGITRPNATSKYFIHRSRFHFRLVMRERQKRRRRNSSRTRRHREETETSARPKDPAETQHQGPFPSKIKHTYQYMQISTRVSVEEIKERSTQLKYL